MSSGGIFAASNLQLGRDADSDGTVTVTGVGSAVNVTNTIMVGRINTGTFNVLAGGTVTASSLQLGREAGSEGNMTVTGTDSAVNVSNVVTVGYGNTGATNASTLNIGDGTTGSVTAQAAVVGRSEGSSGVLNISGGGASLALSGLSGAGNGPTLLAGRFGTGVVNVTNGADLTVDAVIDPTGSRGGLLLGGTSADDLVTTGDGTLNVDGAGSTVIIAHDRAVATIGRQATGAMNITNGGVVTMTNGAAIGNAFSTVGRKSTGVGTVTVDGVGSIWNAGQNLFLGTEVDFSVAGGAALGGGTATVTVSNGGVINVADTVYVDDGATLQGNGTVNGNIFVAAGGLLGPGLSPGTLIIDGDLIIETGATIVLEDFIFGKDELVVSGQVVIQAGAIVEIVIDDLDRLGGVINVDSFFTVSSPTDIQFDPTTSFVFSVLDTSDADDDFTFEIGGTSYDFTFAGGSTSFAAVPEPVSLALFGLGLGAMVVIRRRRKVA